MLAALHSNTDEARGVGGALVALTMQPFGLLLLLTRQLKGMQQETGNE